MKHVVIQAGHVAPREPGFESGTGTTREQEMAILVMAALGDRLEKDGRFRVTVCGGRTPDPRPFPCDAFLSLHGDGSGNSGASGYCLGYPIDSPGSVKLAAAIRNHYVEIPGHPPHGRDNYTRNLAGYYGFSTRRIDSPAKVLVEHGFLTNPDEQAWIFQNIGRIADSHYKALLDYFELPPKREKPPVTAERLAALRKWILARYREGWSWKRIKRSPNWREFRRGGGK